MKQDSDHKLMCISLINVLDERVNGQEKRINNLEGITKEVHASVQKYKATTAAKSNNYGFEK